MISEISSWNSTDKNLEIGMVVSAISPSIVSEASKSHSGIPLLIPGIGVQQGNMEEAKLALARGRANLIVVARSLLVGERRLDKAVLQERAMRFVSLSR